MTTQLSGQWLTWIDSNLKQGCSPQSLLELMIKEGVSPESAEKSLADSMKIQVNNLTVPLPIKELVENNNMIFIAIAAFVEPYLVHTVHDAIRKAKHPEQLVFGIVDQHKQHRRKHLTCLPENPEVRYIHINPAESRGACWARSLTYSLYENESYLLQIDSHMLFELNWDEKLIAELEALRINHAKPIVTTYPYGFEFEGGKPVVKANINDKTTLVLRPRPEETLSDNNATLMFYAEHVYVRKPILGGHISGNFLFTLGHFVQEIPYDPYLYFYGEEQNLAIRAYTHGWDIFHPPHIPLFHLYKDSDSRYLSHHWHPEWERRRDFSWEKLEEAAKQRLMDLLYRHKDLGVYGLGKVRSLADFAQLTGIDYIEHKISKRDYQ